MILGRTLELKYLNNCYEKDGSQILVVYGERNVGKTALLFEFVKGKPYYYYKVRSASDREQRFLWGRELTRQNKKVKEFPTYTELFECMMEGAGEKGLILIDEFQSIVKNSDEFMEELTSFVQNSHQKLMVVLCSSSPCFVENNLIDRIGEMAYHLSGFFKIKELDFEAMQEFFPEYSKEQCMTSYTVLGGLPGLWKCFEKDLTIKENICRHILREDSLLFQEGKRIMEEELRETGVYNSILAVIAQGHHKLNELYLHTGFSRAKISVYLKNLMELELVEKVYSFDQEGIEGTQKGIYQITNHFVNFYFTFLYPNLSSLEMMGAEEFYDQFIAPFLMKYAQESFGSVCRQAVSKWNRQGELPFSVGRVSRWVGKMGNIDVIAQNEDGRTLIGICSYERAAMPFEDYEWLLFCAKKARIRTDFIYLFSLGRFDEKLQLEARIKKNLKLVCLDEM